jgi:endonuclease IV
MHVHNVYFWLKQDLDSQAIATFEQGLEALAKDPAIKSGYYGNPANTEREVVENSYTYGLVFVFDDLAAHDRYQAGKVHLKFVEDHLSKWERVVVYDIEVR